MPEPNARNHLGLSIDAHRRVSAEESREAGNEKSSWPHPLRSSPTRSEAPRLPELDEHQGMPTGEAMEMDVEMGERPVVAVVTSGLVQDVEMVEVDELPPAIPARSPSRLQMRRSVTAAL